MRVDSFVHAVTLGTLAVTLAACGPRQAPAPDPSPSPTGTSIIRDDFERPATTPTALAPLEMRISFAAGGVELSEAAIAELETVLESPQMAGGAPIVLGAHSDSGGTDAANLRATQARGEAIRDWLVERGVDADRITVIAFGEQNPIAPNALPDGSPNEEGRAANRRVDLTIAAPQVPTAEERASLAETVANRDSASAEEAAE